MNPEETDMTRHRSDREPSWFDMPLDTAYARMAAHQAEARRSRLADEGPPDGVVRRLRHGLGHRLIDAGIALAGERRPQTLAR